MQGGRKMSTKEMEKKLRELKELKAAMAKAAEDRA